jgi:16S rRNA (cytidine1402-2'-O)-methyltransferase
MLYIVATPIGNLGDISKRAVEVLKSVDLILAEDTRSAGKLLQALGIAGKKVESFFEHSEEKKIPEVIKYLKSFNKPNAEFGVALISESGTPLISDPGFKLVRECHREGIKVVPIPGPTALTTALCASGVPTDKFMFVGFLPKSKSKQKELLVKIKESQQLVKTSIVIYESPFRLLVTLREIREIWGNIEICVASELTKIYENIEKDSIKNQIKKYSLKAPRGEVTLVF